MDCSLPCGHLETTAFASHATRRSPSAGACIGGLAGTAAFTSFKDRNVMRWTHHRTQKPPTVPAGSGVAPVPGKHLELEQRAKRLRLRLQESGPAYSCFALYLASRLDALPAEYCREFALTRDSAHILSPAQVHGT